MKVFINNNKKVARQLSHRHHDHTRVGKVSESNSKGLQDEER
jgi:hypothetical protein